jgi:hypothetical protein
MVYLLTLGELLSCHAHCPRKIGRGQPFVSTFAIHSEDDQLIRFF